MRNRHHDNGFHQVSLRVLLSFYGDDVVLFLDHFEVFATVLNGRGRGAERTEPPAVESSSGTVPVQKGLGWGPYLQAKADTVGTHGPFRGNLNGGVYVGQDMPDCRALGK